MSSKKFYVDIDLNNNKLNNTQVGENSLLYSVQGAFGYGTNGLQINDAGTVRDVIHSGNVNNYAQTATASNGLNKVGNDIQLGGTLTSNINLTGTSYNFTFDVNGFNVTDNGNGMSFSSPSGGVIYFETVSGASNSNIELYGNSMDIYVDGATSSTDMFINDNAINMQSTDNSTYRVQLNVTNSTVVSKYAKNSMSSIETVHSFQRTSRSVPNAPLVGFGAKMTFDLQGATGGALASPVGVSYSWTDATPGALHGKYSQSVHIASTPTEIIELDRYGYRYLADYSLYYNDRTLVDKAYVLNQISIASTSGNSSPTSVIVSFPMGVDSSTTITTGAKGRYPISFSGTITGWIIVANTSSNVTLDIWKANNAIPTNANSIFGTKPSLTSQELNSATGLNIAVSAKDIFILEVEANDVATYIKIDLQITQ